MANPPAPDIDRPTVVIEADTVEDALARVSRELGPDARIVSADRTRKGGIAGFFAREVVALVAELPAENADSAPGDTPSLAETDPNLPAAPRGLDSAFARLLAEAEMAESATGAPAKGAHVSSGRSPSGSTPAVRWDAGRLLELGLPERVVQCIADLDPGDDAAHITTLATSFAPICGPMPEGPHRLVGSSGKRARATRDQDLPIHLVLDGSDLPDWLPATPAIISWSRPQAAPRAIAMALFTGATLGWWQPCGSARIRRVTPLDAAFTLRELMERT